MHLLQAKPTGSGPPRHCRRASGRMRTLITEKRIFFYRSFYTLASAIARRTQIIL